MRLLYRTRRRRAATFKARLDDASGPTAAPLAERPAGTLRFAGAPRPGLLPPTKQKAQINPGLSLSLDEKRGSRQFLAGKQAFFDDPADDMRRDDVDLLNERRPVRRDAQAHVTACRRRSAR
jgi:hypothetical protein